MPDLKLLVANRGEIACRIIRAARSLGLCTVAVHSDADVELPHVEMADEAYSIGPARPAESYLDRSKLFDVARRSGARLIHPGYGFLSENASFASDCAQAGLVFVGPPPEVITAMGDKERARRTAARAGVPVLAGTDKLADDAPAVATAAQRVGFPLLVKASAGGGGIGMRLVDTPEALAAAVQSTRSLAQKAFGDGSIYLERLVTRARHVEIQVFGFGNGEAVHLFERDCSLQRRHQKVIEEARAPGLRPEVAARIADAAVRLCAASRYAGAGTAEFLVDAETQDFYFLEMNTRIQVEHPVTEMITGVDLVAAQIRFALEDASLRSELAQAGIASDGHAIEARVYAENPAKNFMPSPGPLRTLDLPSGAGVRVECGFRQGNAVTPFYDPMLMKVIAHGVSREHAIQRLDAALESLRIEGVAHNVGYLRACLRHPDFVAGSVHTGLLGQRHAALVATAQQLTGGVA
ncbi:MAG: acetyl-CoA carboxylase biotin carboxylase subunit [Betaproteobacteria bacterium]|nr:acetyl-CoA carboxylase biotin carboxylase subunit [Betaproteobacteria bacterium]